MSMQTQLIRARKRLAHTASRHHDAETVRQERKRAGEARGAMMRHREALYLAELEAEGLAV